jgi:hypothetical protein
MAYRQVRNALYKVVQKEPTHYEVMKFTSDLEHLETYHVNYPGGSPHGICNCPAGPNKECRHQKMVAIFKANDAFRSGDFYNFDKGTWVPGMSVDMEP